MIAGVLRGDNNAYQGMEDAPAPDSEDGGMFHPNQDISFFVCFHFVLNLFYIYLLLLQLLLPMKRVDLTQLLKTGKKGTYLPLSNFKEKKKKEKRTKKKRETKQHS